MVMGSLIGTAGLLVSATAVRRKRRNTSRLRHDAGLTLVELLVVLGILALFASLAVPQVLRYLGYARTQTAKTQLTSISSAIELYHLDLGQYPPQDFGLKALIESPPQLAGWKGPYLKKSGALMDPWGRPYIYKVPGEHGVFDLSSLGRDGQVGGSGEDEDATSW